MPSKNNKIQITKTELKLAKEVKELAKEVRKLKDLEFIRIFKHPWKFMWFSLLKGIMVGFGSVLGATVVVAFFIFILAKISLVPIVGDFVQDIIHQVQTGQIQEQPAPADNSFVDQHDAAKKEFDAEYK